MANIRLTKMKKNLCRLYYQKFTYDPATFINPNDIIPYHYTEDHADRQWKRQQDLGRIHLAIMFEDNIIGDIVFKKIEPKEKHCTMAIHLVNDTVKNWGYGTEAEILALEYAFQRMGMKTVFADALRTNTRSRHVLEKVGFREISFDELFCYYQYDYQAWNAPEYR